MSRNPYNFNGKEPNMQHSVVLFLDILGYSDMVKQSFQDGKGNDLLRKLHSTLKEARTNFAPIFEEKGENPPNPWDIKVFTDNIVVGWPIYDDGELELGHTLIRVAAYQMNLAIEGFFVRGGISIGSHYMDNEIVYGPALIVAHEIENSMARDPRIVLCSNTLKLAKDHTAYYTDKSSSPHNELLLIDTDQQCFVNYLAASFEYDSFNHEVLAKHKDQVINRLREYLGNPQIWSKYCWVANYHNYFCSNFLSDCSELLIDEAVLLPKPRRLISD